MKDKLVRWHVMDSKDKDLLSGYGFGSRRDARGYKKELTQDMFMHWNEDVNYPLHIERLEYQLIDRKKVR